MEDQLFLKQAAPHLARVVAANPTVTVLLHLGSLAIVTSCLDLDLEGPNWLQLLMLQH